MRIICIHSTRVQRTRNIWQSSTAPSTFSISGGRLVLVLGMSGYLRGFHPLPLSLLFQFLSIFSLLPDRSLAPAGNKIQGLARRHCELLTPSSFTRPGFAYVMRPSIFHDSVFHSRSVWFDKHKLLDNVAFVVVKLIFTHFKSEDNITS